MGEYDFDLDLARSHKTVSEVRCLLRQGGFTVLRENTDGRYDLLTKSEKGIEIKIEIKEDFLHKDTGNVAVEFESRGKASGIAATEAAMWVYKLHEARGAPTYWMTTAERIRKLVAEKKYRRIVNGGDEGSNTLFYLFSSEVFKAECLQLVPRLAILDVL